MLRDVSLPPPQEMAAPVSILVSITSFDEDLRQKMEPRTTTAKQILRTIREQSEAGYQRRCDARPDDNSDLNVNMKCNGIMKEVTENDATYLGPIHLSSLNGGDQTIVP